MQMLLEVLSETMRPMRARSDPIVLMSNVSDDV